MAIGTNATELSGLTACTTMHQERSEARGSTAQVLVRAAAIMGCVWAVGSRYSKPESTGTGSP